MNSKSTTANALTPSIKKIKINQRKVKHFTTKAGCYCRKSIKNTTIKRSNK